MSISFFQNDTRIFIQRKTRNAPCLGGTAGVGFQLVFSWVVFFCLSSKLQVVPAGKPQCKVNTDQSIIGSAPFQIGRPRRTRPCFGFKEGRSYRIEARVEVNMVACFQPNFGAQTALHCEYCLDIIGGLLVKIPTSRAKECNAARAGSIECSAPDTMPKSGNIYLRRVFMHFNIGHHCPLG